MTSIRSGKIKKLFFTFLFFFEKNFLFWFYCLFVKFLSNPFTHKPWSRNISSSALTPPMTEPIPWTRSWNFTVRMKDHVVGPLLASSLPTQVFLCCMCMCHGFVRASTYLCRATCSSCAKPLSDRLSWAFHVTEHSLSEGRWQNTPKPIYVWWCQDFLLRT
jgi:hypothetical protein